MAITQDKNLKCNRGSTLEMPLVAIKRIHGNQNVTVFAVFYFCSKTIGSFIIIIMDG